MVEKGKILYRFGVFLFLVGVGLVEKGKILCQFGVFFSLFFWSFLQRPWGLVCGVEEALVVFVVEEAQFYSFMYLTFIGKGKPVLFSLYV